MWVEKISKSNKFQIFDFNIEPYNFQSVQPKRNQW